MVRRHPDQSHLENPNSYQKLKILWILPILNTNWTDQKSSDYRGFIMKGDWEMHY